MSTQPSIRTWKTTQPQSGYPDWWQRWRSPDVFVDNDGDRVASNDGTFEYYQNVDEVCEPVKGRSDNRLFAVVQNLGSTAATGVQVEFSYAPYGVVGGTLYQHSHFKTIATAIVDLSPTGSPDSKKAVEVQWDLSDLSENNGGVWPAPAGYFTHFCVNITLNFPADSNLADNQTQHNFGNVLSSSPFSPIPILIANTGSKEEQVRLVTRPLKEWKIELRNSIDKSDISKKNKRQEDTLLDSFSLKAGDARFTTLKIAPLKIMERSQDVEVSLIIGDKSVGGFSLRATKGATRLSRIPCKRCNRPLGYALAPSFSAEVSQKKLTK
jgi:hypothetical protein